LNISSVSCVRYQRVFFNLNYWLLHMKFVFNFEILRMWHICITINTRRFWLFHTQHHADDFENEQKKNPLEQHSCLLKSRWYQNASLLFNCIYVVVLYGLVSFVRVISVCTLSGFVLCIICFLNKCKKWQQTCFCHFI
jgi:hypothetical protein